jgi:hypothetical protein
VSFRDFEKVARDIKVRREENHRKLIEQSIISLEQDDDTVSDSK